MIPPPLTASCAGGSAVDDAAGRQREDLDVVDVAAAARSLNVFDAVSQTRPPGLYVAGAHRPCGRRLGTSPGPAPACRR